MPGKWSKPEWDNLAVAMPSPTAKEDCFKVYLKLDRKLACLPTGLKTSKWSLSNPPTYRKSRAKQDQKTKKANKKNWHRNVRSDENATKESFGQNKHLLYTWKKYLHDKNISRHQQVHDQMKRCAIVLNVLTQNESMRKFPCYEPAIPRQHSQTLPHAVTTEITFH